ncbi:Serine/threonine-protein kinase pkn1 [Thalassoglobus neptunius]|uniref:Serine/threonine-protein kinase pkn1 n=1 Tax=Thalassoglobus neptunius TaxID=1938619 RepID=A0A5C5VMK6_9PLAN|nr:formylglycine-generating enzyme family protein [Thalassoglobus neptunius]TWT39884.1 Serine/threonine-protein kinase pkn1 [Thalassoglobus neptunius]
MNSKSLNPLLLLLCLDSFGCGARLPELSVVKSQMAPEQLAIGEPFVNSIGMTLVPIPQGRFLMGTSESKPKENKKKAKSLGDKSEFPQHQVQITKPYFIGICEVTQSQYEHVMNESPWENQPLTTENANIAASYITWDRAKRFCEKLSERENAIYRLPSEAEWEYACRAGTSSSFSFGEDWQAIGEHAWFDQNAYQASERYAHAVGQKKPNAWSLYDMHGNVWEWCTDYHERYGERVDEAKGEPVIDPKGPVKGWARVWRGGGFADSAINLRSATRNSYGRVDYKPDFMAGFRVVKEIP